MAKRSNNYGKRAGRYRSGLERTVAESLTKQKVKFQYETQRIPYQKRASYIPDFILPNGVIIETKGRFVSSDRAKHLLVKEQHPSLDIRFVFSNSKAKLYKGSKTTYADWCDKHGFKYADKAIPKDWIKT